jgi:flagellar export protein FliJ
VKAFTFRLEQALRWRGTQVSAQQARVAAAVARRSSLLTQLDAIKAEAAIGAADIIREPAGVALAAYPAFAARTHARISQLDTDLAAAERALAVGMDLLVVANTELRLLENLRSREQARWRTEFDRELSTFADEAFLSHSLRGRLKGTIR